MYLVLNLKTRYIYSCMNFYNNKIKYFVIFFVSTFLVGCKKEYTVEFIIQNRSQRKLQINFQKLDQSQIDSNQINSGQELTFLIEMAEGQKTEDYLDDLTEIPIDFLEITDLNQNNLTCNPLNIDCWTTEAPEEKNGVGYVLRSVRDTDFE